MRKLVSRASIFFALLTMGVFAQQADSLNQIAERYCRTAESAANGNAALLPSHPELQSELDRLKPLQSACSAFRSSRTAEFATNVVNAMGEYNPAFLPPKERLAKYESRAEGVTGIQLFYQLANLAKAAFDAGELAKAQSYARELLEMAPQYPENWNYGNAVYFGNMVLGRIDVARGDLPAAAQHLFAAALTPGSPQLNSFGPNTSLAKDLLERGERDVVLQYFDLVRTFWRMDHDKLGQWAGIVRRGGIPDFGANLVY